MTAEDASAVALAAGTSVGAVGGGVIGALVSKHRARGALIGWGIGAAAVAALYVAAIYRAKS